MIESILFAAHSFSQTSLQPYVRENHRENSPVEIVEVIEPTNIPIQTNVEDENYTVFFEKASQFVGRNTSECAKFFNRLFGVRFGHMTFGNAWELQLHPDNQKFLKLVWQIPEESFFRDKLLALKDKSDRIKHYQELYDQLDKEEMPIGALGLVYRYSFYREEISQNPKVLPQTHIAFLAGRRNFTITNETEGSLTIEEILNNQYGEIHDSEREFVKSHLPLTKVLKSGASMEYEDYLIEEHFRSPMSGSLLSLFLRKHRNNRTTPLLRPVSYSQISEKLQGEIGRQAKITKTFEHTKIITGTEFAELNWDDKNLWKETLKINFNLEYPEKSLLVPVPIEAMATQLVAK
jgi:hypothetical protein